MDKCKQNFWLLILLFASRCFGTLGDITLSQDGAKIIWNNNSQTFSIASSGSMSESINYIWPPADAVAGGQSLLSDAAGVLSWGTPTTATAHNILSGTHDATTNGPTRGSIIYGNATPEWDELVIGAANTFLKSDGTDASWSLLAVSSPVTLSGATVGWDSTLIDATTWSDGSNASNIWTFDVSGTDHTMTAGNGTMDFSHNISAAGLTIIGSTILGLDSAVFQPTTDSTTFFQVLDADGGTPVFNVDTTNERVGINIENPGGQLHSATSGEPSTLIIDRTDGKVISILAGLNSVLLQFDDSGQFQFAANDAASIRAGLSTSRLDILTIQSSGKIGIIEEDPETLLHLTSFAPYITLQNATHEDSDGGRESRIIAKGEQSGGEETTLARIEVSHDGAADDEKGKIVIGINDGSNTNTPTEILEIDSTGGTFWKNTGGLVFGHMYVDGTQSIIVALTLNTPAEVEDDGTTSAEDGWLAGDLNLITFPTGGTEHYITVTKAGIFHITWNLSFKMVTGAANTQIHAGLAVDGTAIRDKCEAHRTISNNTDTGNMAGSCMVDLPNGTEELSLWMENTTNSNDAEVVHGSITAIQVGGT